jgi:hypothetical protein
MLEGISIAAPCSANWDSMPGTDRVRHCAQCGKNVYNLSAMTRRKAEKLLRETEGNLCARLYQRGDGTILTENCPAGLRAIGSRVSRWAGAAMALSSVAMAQIPLVQVASAQEQHIEYAISGVLHDEAGAVIPGRVVTVFEESTGKNYIARSDSAGFFRIGALASSSYRVKVEFLGFQSFEKWILLGSEDEAKLDVAMRVAVMGEVVVIKKKHHWWQL